MTQGGFMKHVQGSTGVAGGVSAVKGTTREAYDKPVFRCPGKDCGRRLPVSDIQVTGSLTVYCRHCGRRVRLSIDAAQDRLS